MFRDHFWQDFSEQSMDQLKLQMSCVNILSSYYWIYVFFFCPLLAHIHWILRTHYTACWNIPSFLQIALWIEFNSIFASTRWFSDWVVFDIFHRFVWTNGNKWQATGNKEPNYEIKNRFKLSVMCRQCWVVLSFFLELGAFYMSDGFIGQC